jgi:hypothetical protein
MNAQVKTLIPAILSSLNEKHCNVSKTKLLKLLYLFDVEFYRAHQKSFTGFDWTFYHLGPWTAEIDEVLGALILGGTISEFPFATNEFEGVVLRAKNSASLRDALSDVKDQFILMRILKDWGEQPTGRLLDHVYFHTEPMERGQRNQGLDFSLIATEQPKLYKRSSSNTTPSMLEKKKREFQAKLAARTEAKKSEVLSLSSVSIAASNSAS